MSGERVAIVGLEHRRVNLLRPVKEAIERCLEVEEPVSNEFVGVQRVAVMA